MQWTDTESVVWVLCWCRLSDDEDGGKKKRKKKGKKRQDSSEDEDDRANTSVIFVMHRSSRLMFLPCICVWYMHAW